MNETLKTLYERRSVRSYKAEPISKENLETIVSAGKAAASGMNRQPYHITVVQKPEAIEELCILAKNEILSSPMAERAKDPSFNPVYNAPAVIIVSADPENGLYQFDSTLVMGNMFIGARSIGIGSCWLHLFGSIADKPEAKAVYAKLGVPDGHRVIVASCFGYPDGEWPEAREKRDDNVNYLL